MLARLAEVRPPGALLLAVAIGWFASYLWAGGCVLVLIGGVMGPYLACRIGGRWEPVAGPLVNLAMFASAAYRSDPRVLADRGLDLFILLALLFMAVGFIIGYGVRDGRRRSAHQAA